MPPQQLMQAHLTLRRSNRISVRIRRQPEMTMPRPAVRKLTAPRHSPRLMKLSRTGAHRIVDRLLNRRRITPTTGSRSLVSVAFVIAVVVVGSVDQSARVLVGFTFDLGGDIVVELDGGVAGDDDFGAGCDAGDDHVDGCAFL